MAKKAANFNKRSRGTGTGRVQLQGVVTTFMVPRPMLGDSTTSQFYLFLDFLSRSTSGNKNCKYTSSEENVFVGKIFLSLVLVDSFQHVTSFICNGTIHVQ